MSDERDNLDIETTIPRSRPASPASAIPPIPFPATPVPGSVQQAPNAAPSVLPIGYVLDDKFVITKVLGKGGLGIVYKATERQTGVEFAIKIVASELVNDVQARNDLRQEVANAQRITHQNLLKINYLADSGPVTYLVMECIDGENLEEYRVRKGGRIAIDDFRKITPQVLAALDYLHEKGVVHCDVKPQNIMVTPAGEVKVTDYGIARTIKEQLARGAAAQASTGTLAYMAPEQIRGNEVCDRRADIYSVGVMFHRLLTGEFPFDTRDRQAIINWHLDEKHTIHGTGSSELNGILGKSLAVAPAARYQTCGALLNDLRAAGILCDAPAAAAPVAAPTVQGTHVENLLHLTRLTRQLMLKTPYELLFAVFSKYPSVIKGDNGEYQLLKRGPGASVGIFNAFKAAFAKKVNPAEELGNEVSAITARGIALDHRLQHNIDTLVREAEQLQSKLFSALQYRGIAFAGAAALLLVCLVCSGVICGIAQSPAPLLIVPAVAVYICPFLVAALWGLAVRRQLVDDIVRHLKKPQGSDMY